MTIQELRDRLGNPEDVASHPFEILREICSYANNGAGEEDLQDLVLRALEHRESFGSNRVILEGLVREVGLFPFIENPDELGLADRLAYEFHKPANLEKRGIVFHRPQARVYRELLAGNNVVLSAPTSFGKSLVIDGVIASGRFNNILIIVPTIALIDETRRRLSTFSGEYKLITHPTQKAAQRNIYVMTQERVLEHPDLDSIDLFVVDEFYKLSPSGENDDRTALLNQAFYALTKRGKQFYMLGPSITGVIPELSTRLEFKWILEPYNTVVSELHRVERGDNELDALANLCRTLHSETLVFCKSVPRAIEVATALVERQVGERKEELEPAIRWLSKNYHEDWHLVRALKNGIGVHHGRVPRAIAQYLVRAFNDGALRYLICTSTLIEGVNTKAKNMVILDDKIDKARYDFFTFNNIRGRSGRMFQHFVGHVYLFNPPPNEELPLIDVPAYTQSPTTPESLLLQLEEKDLKPDSRTRLQKYVENPALSYSVLKENVGVDPEAQIEVAELIASDLELWWPKLSWTGYPSYDELYAVSQLIWDHFGGSRLGAGSARSIAQLTVMIRQLSRAPSTRSLIQGRIEFGLAPDEAVQGVLDFMRLWATFHFPRLLRAIDRIQRNVFGRENLKPGNYEVYSSRVESLFLPPGIVALDEYGVPIEVGRRISQSLRGNMGLDDVLDALRTLPEASLELDPFEEELLRDAKQCL